jgi:hypothetical protein
MGTAGFGKEGVEIEVGKYALDPSEKQEKTDAERRFLYRGIGSVPF